MNSQQSHLFVAFSNLLSNPSIWNNSAFQLQHLLLAQGCDLFTDGNEEQQLQALRGWLSFTLSDRVMTNFSKKRKSCGQDEVQLPSYVAAALDRFSKEMLIEIKQLQGMLDFQPSQVPREEQLNCLGIFCKRANRIAKQPHYQALGTKDTLAHICVLMFVLVWAQRLRDCRELWENVMKYVAESGIDGKCQAYFPRCMTGDQDDYCRCIVVKIHVTLLTAVWKYGAHTSQPINKNFLTSALAALFRCKQASLTSGKCPSLSMKLVQDYWDQIDEMPVYSLSNDEAAFNDVLDILILDDDMFTVNDNELLHFIEEESYYKRPKREN